MQHSVDEAHEAHVVLSNRDMPVRSFAFVRGSGVHNRPVRCWCARVQVRATMLQPEDVAAAALMVATLPSRAHVPELVINGHTTVQRGGVPMW